MYKPNFTVVTCVLFAFAIMAFAHKAFVGLVPPVKTNSLATSRQRFLAVAGHQEIEWHTIDNDAVWKQARLSEKPILLVVGVSASKYGHDFDSIVFEDADTAKLVSLNYFCIRVDGYEHPEWLNAVLPITRSKYGLATGIQVLTLDSEGEVLSIVRRTNENGSLNASGMYDTLVNARRQYDSAIERRAASRRNQDLQSRDSDVLDTAPTGAFPDLQLYTQTLDQRRSAVNGGFPHDGTQELFPNAWRFLSLIGNKKLWHESIEPILASRLVDLQDGGFFRIGLTPEVSRVEFDKGIRQNAEMMLALAIESQIEQDSFTMYLAGATFDWLKASGRHNGMLPACQEDDENPQGRSPRLSFPTWRMWEVLDAQDRAWASEQLGLNPLTNSQMVPYLTTRATLQDFKATYDRILGLLRTSTLASPEFNDSGYLDVNGHAIARMLEVARLWGDDERMQSLRLPLNRLKEFRDEEGLLHAKDDDDPKRSYLGDYLAFADVRLQQYLAFGSAQALQEGLYFLNLARSSFRSVRPGQLNLSRNADDMGGFTSLCVPEIIDNVAESCTAQAIRLELAYGRLTADKPIGQELLRDARQSTLAFQHITEKAGPSAAGYFCSAVEVMDGRYAITVGPEAKQLADSFYRDIPTRFVAPALDTVRRDLQAKAPGIYVIGKSISGPYTEEQALRQLPAALVPQKGP